MTNVMIIDYYMAFIIVCFIKMFYKKRNIRSLEWPAEARFPRKAHSYF